MNINILVAEKGGAQAPWGPIAGSATGLLGRLPKAKDPKKEVNACSDALLTVLEGHFTTAACQILNIKNHEEEPVSISAVKCPRCSIDKKKAYITRIATEIVNKYTIIEEALLNKQVVARVIFYSWW